MICCQMFQLGIQLLGAVVGTVPLVEGWQAYSMLEVAKGSCRCLVSSSAVEGQSLGWMGLSDVCFG